MTVKPLEVLLALKAVSLAPGLMENDRRVAATLLEHFNRNTGECDPGLERIATLLCISTRTVIRATQRLEKAGLFRKVRHGGHLNRNSYEPLWKKFHEIEAAWRARFSESARSRRSQVSPSPSRSCHVQGDTRVPQTCLSNQFKETCSSSPPKQADEPDLSSKRGQREIGVTRSADAARVAAERRWSSDLHQRFSSQPITYSEIVGAIDPRLQQAATDAELRRHGDGVSYIIEALGVFTGVRATNSKDCNNA
jgi:hypothetical protein